MISTWTTSDLGLTKMLCGNVTTLKWIGPRAPPEVERSVGYRPGRLKMGYFIALLRKPLNVDDFDLAGITLRSGGRLGLPEATRRLDEKRPTVKSSILERDGEAAYNALKQTAMAYMTIRGGDRIAKVLPLERLGDNFNPAHEFPMGGGGAQWNIIRGRDKPFFVAAFVNDRAEATFGNHVNLCISYDHGKFLDVYENKMLLAHYLAFA